MVNSQHQKELQKFKMLQFKMKEDGLFRVYWEGQKKRRSLLWRSAGRWKGECPSSCPQLLLFRTSDPSRPRRGRSLVDSLAVFDPNLGTPVYILSGYLIPSCPSLMDVCVRVCWKQKSNLESVIKQRDAAVVTQ